MIKRSVEISQQNLEILFKNPPNEYKVFPIMHNLCDPEGEQDIQKKLQEAIDSGAGGIVTNTTWNDKEWVNKKSNLELLEKGAHLAKAQSLNVWMYDDYWYPSGWANGYAIKDNPEYACQNITYILEQGQGITAISLSREIDNWGFLYAAFYNVDTDNKPDFSAPFEVQIIYDEINCTSPDGKWLFMAFYIKRHCAAEEEKQEAAKHPGGYREYLNFLNKNAVDKFIETALEPVAEHFGADFGKHFDAVFTDEPTLAGPYLCFPRGKVDFKDIPAPYGPTLFKEFQEKWGYDLREKLPYLFIENSKAAKRVRLHYYRTISDIALSVFTQNVAAWCKAHQTSASGHFLLEEGLLYHVGYYGDYMKVMSGQDYPGCDVLCADAQKFWEKRSGFDTSWLFAGKYPSSASRIKGHNITMMEICPVNYTDKININPFKEFMGLTTSVIFTGITHYNSYGYNYIKDNEQHKLWNQYTGRLLMVLRNAVSDCRLGVYYPIATAQSLFTGQALQPEPAVDLIQEAYSIENKMEQMANDLYIGKLDFNILTEEAILNAEIMGDKLQAAKMQVNALIVPFNDFLPLAVVKKLLEFAKSGGKVYFVDGLPLNGLDEFEDKQILELKKELLENCGVVALNDIPSLAQKLLMDVNEQLTVKGEGIFCSRYSFLGKTVYYIINIKEQSQAVTFESAHYKNIKVFNPIDGSILDIPLPASIAIEGERGLLIFVE